MYDLYSSLIDLLIDKQTFNCIIPETFTIHHTLLNLTTGNSLAISCLLIGNLDRKINLLQPVKKTKNKDENGNSFLHKMSASIFQYWIDSFFLIFCFIIFQVKRLTLQPIILKMHTRSTVFITL